MSVVFNADESLEMVTRVVFQQDVREVHSRCLILFSLPEEVVFGRGDTFIYMGHEWEAVSFKIIRVSSSYMYSVMGFPYGVCERVGRVFRDAASLARGLGSSLVGENFEFEFPVNGVSVGPLLYKYRQQSFERYKDDLGRAWFLFFDQRGLVSSTYSGLLAGSSVDFDLDASLYMGGSFSFVRDYMRSEYLLDSVPAAIKYKNLVRLLVGDKVDVSCTMSGVIGGLYNLVSSGDTFHDFGSSVLIRQRYDSGRQSAPWSLTFGKLRV
jgi:hypothetical protein